MSNHSSSPKGERGGLKLLYSIVYLIKEEAVLRDMSTEITNKTPMNSFSWNSETS